MSYDVERSEAGNPIYRHKPPDKAFEFALGDSDAIEAISQHIETHLGKIETVYHELVSDHVHVDVHTIEPTEDRDFYTLVTSGMSDRPMNVPRGAEAFRYAELMLALPPTWLLGEKHFKNDDNYWPIRLLKQLARFPHQYDTWLGPGHTIPNDDPPQPYASNTKLCCAILLYGVTTPDAFNKLEISPEKTIRFYAVIPLYQEEMELKLRSGTEALFPLFDEHGVSELVDLRRRNTARRRS